MTEVISKIDEEIARLQQARALLSGSASGAVKAGRGRPRGSKNATSSGDQATRKTKRQLSPEGRKAIAEAMKKRWAERRKAAPAK